MWKSRESHLLPLQPGRVCGVAVRLNAEPGAVGPITPVKTKALPGVAPYPYEQSVPSGSRPLSNLVASCLSVLGLGCPLLPASPLHPSASMWHLKMAYFCLLL